jgi:hypothetical protein
MESVVYWTQRGRCRELPLLGTQSLMYETLQCVRAYTDATIDTHGQNLSRICIGLVSAVPSRRLPMI